MMAEGKDSNEEFMGSYLGRWSREIGRIWDSLDSSTKDELVGSLNLIPGDPKRWKSLVEQSIEHMQLVAGGKQYVAIVGPANVGKSTLYNQFIRSDRDESLVSSVPGTTKVSIEADAGLFEIVDTPGMDAVGTLGIEEKRNAIQAAEEADVIVLLFDAAQGIRNSERNLFDEILSLDRPTVVALNKMDLVRREKASIIGNAAAGLDIESEQIIPVSAKYGEGLDRLLINIAQSEPGIVAALGAGLPEYRWSLSQLTIGRSASTAGAIAIAPLPFISFIPLLGIQTALVISIARIYDFKITVARARELIAVFGVGILARTLFYELIKLGGPPAWAVSAAVAAGTTVAIGYGATVWFERGAKISTSSLRRIAQEVSATVLNRLKTFGRRRPGESTLRERVYQAIDEMEEIEIEDS